jgi:hypothetical protein
MHQSLAKVCYILESGDIYLRSLHYGLFDPSFRYFWSIHKFELEFSNIGEDKFKGLHSNSKSMMRFSKIGLWYFLCNKI